MKINTHHSTAFQNGDTPLHIASSEGETDTVSLLLDGGAEVNIKDNVSTEKDDNVVMDILWICGYLHCDL